MLLRPIELVALIDPILDDCKPVVRNYTFRMKLYTLHVRESLVSHAHHNSIIAPRRHLEFVMREDVFLAILATSAVNDETVVARGTKGILEALQHANTRMRDK